MSDAVNKPKVPPLLDANYDVEAPAVLLPYQQKWLADEAQLKIAEKSRRIGLTWAEAADCALIAASDKKSGGQNVYYVGYNQDMTLEFIEACAMWARSFNYAASEIEEGIFVDDDGEKEIKTYTIRFPKAKNRITALSSRPSNLRGKQGVVVIDEAAFHEDLAGLIKAALALLIWGGKVRIISTHNGDENPFNDLIQEVRALKRTGSVHKTTFREAVEQGLYQRICLRRGIDYDKAEEAAWMAEVYKFYGDDAEEELDVIPAQGGGRCLTMGQLEKLQNDERPVITFTAPKEFELWTEDARNVHVDKWLKETVDPILLTLDKTQPHYYGLDFARHHDACSMWWQAERLNMSRYCPFVLEMEKTPYKQQERICIYVIERVPRFNKGANDAGGNGEYLAEALQIKFGAHRIDAVKLSEGWYAEHTPHFAACLTDGTIEDMPADRDIRDDHLLFTKIKGVMRIPARRTTSSNGNKRHGDSGIAHLLCDYASKYPTPEMAWTRVPIDESEVPYAMRDAWDDLTGFGGYLGHGGW
jgi:phage FluMu gp28-like protein